MSIFDIDPDVRRARTLPSAFYLEPEYFDASKQRIFSRAWHFVGTMDDGANLRPVMILEGFLDEPLLISRSNGEPCGFSNVCTHRGKILVEEPCDATLIRCGYHGRRFSLGGKFMSMPEFEDVDNFPTEADDLAPIPLKRWGKFLFASPGPAVDFDRFTEDLRPLVDPLMEVEYRFAGEREFDVRAHWALYCENYLEGFHIPYVHRSLNQAIDYGSYSTKMLRYASVQTALDSEGGIAAHYVFLFPNLMLNFYPWGLSVNIVRPVTPSESRVTFLTYVSNPSQVETGAGAGLDRVEAEDEAVVESVQKGIRSRFYDRGRYSPSREQGTHHFHRLIAEFMA